MNEIPTILETYVNSSDYDLCTRRTFDELRSLYPDHKLVLVDWEQARWPNGQASWLVGDPPLVLSWNEFEQFGGSIEWHFFWLYVGIVENTAVPNTYESCVEPTEALINWDTCKLVLPGSIVEVFVFDCHFLGVTAPGVHLQKHLIDFWLSEFSESLTGLRLRRPAPQA